MPGCRVPQGVPDTVEAILAQHLQETGDAQLFYRGTAPPDSSKGWFASRFPSGLLSNLCQKGRYGFRPFFLDPRFTCKSRYLCGTLGRTRTCDLLIRSLNW